MWKTQKRHKQEERVPLSVTNTTTQEHVLFLYFQKTTRATLFFSGEVEKTHLFFFCIPQNLGARPFFSQALVYPKL